MINGQSFHEIGGETANIRGFYRSRSDAENPVSGLAQHHIRDVQAEPSFARRSRSNSRVEGSYNNHYQHQIHMDYYGGRGEDSDFTPPPQQLLGSNSYQSPPRRRSKSWGIDTNNQRYDENEGYAQSEKDYPEMRRQQYEQIHKEPSKQIRASNNQRQQQFDTYQQADYSRIGASSLSGRINLSKQPSGRQNDQSSNRSYAQESHQQRPVRRGENASLPSISLRTHKSRSSHDLDESKIESWLEKISKWIGVHSYIFDSDVDEGALNDSSKRYSRLPQHDPAGSKSGIEMKSYSEKSTKVAQEKETQPPDEPLYPRMIDRGNDQKPGGRIFVRKRIKKKDWYALYGFDWFHSLIDAPTSRIILILMSLYLGIVFFFAIVYYEIHCSYFCDLDFNTFVGAFDFTLETMATIGYGTKNIYFDDCMIVAIVLAAQMCIRLILDAFVIGVIYCRIARPNARASTVIFSNHGIIRRVRGKLYFMFQLCELRKHQLVEAHVRLYLVKREVDESVMDNRRDWGLSSDSSDKVWNEEDDNSRNGNYSQKLRGNKESKSSKYTSSSSYQHYDHRWKDHEFDDDDYVMTNPSDSGGTGRRNKYDDNSRSYRQDYRSDMQPSSMGLRNRSYSSGAGSDRNNMSRRGEKVENATKYTYLQTCSMRLNHPNDEVGSMLLLMVPQVVVHELDATSPLMPPPMWISANSREVVRWNPPVYKPFEVRPTNQTTPSTKAPPTFGSSIGSHRSSQRGERSFDRDQMSPHYNMEALSNMGFPNVIRRSSDYLKSVGTVGPTNISTDVISPLNRTAFEATTDVDAIGKDASKMDLLDTAHNVNSTTVIPPISTMKYAQVELQEKDDNQVRTPRRSVARLRHEKGDSGTNRTAMADSNDHKGSLISPGLQRYQAHLTGSGPANNGLHSRSRSGKNERSTSNKASSYPQHCSYNNVEEYESDDNEPQWQREEKEMIRRYMLDRQVEIIAVVEGIDPATGGNVQARHSYIFNEIEWDKRFQHCVYQDPEDFYATVDFDLFHELTDAPKDAAYPGPVPSCI